VRLLRVEGIVEPLRPHLMTEVDLLVGGEDADALVEAAVEAAAVVAEQRLEVGLLHIGFVHNIK